MVSMKSTFLFQMLAMLFYEAFLLIKLSSRVSNYKKLQEKRFSHIAIMQDIDVKDTKRL